MIEFGINYLVKIRDQIGLAKLNNLGWVLRFSKNKSRKKKWLKKIRNLNIWNKKYKKYETYKIKNID